MSRATTPGKAPGQKWTVKYSEVRDATDEIRLDGAQRTKSLTDHTWHGLHRGYGGAAVIAD